MDIESRAAMRPCAAMRGAHCDERLAARYAKRHETTRRGLEISKFPDPYVEMEHDKDEDMNESEAIVFLSTSVDIC